MELPVPGIFLYKEADTNEHLVIDGQQRLLTLQMFYDGLFKDKKFRLEGGREPWLNKAYDELESADVLDSPADVCGGSGFLDSGIS